MFYPQALAAPVVLGEGGPSHFFFCTILISLLLLAVVVKLEPALPRPQPYFFLGLSCLSWAAFSEWLCPDTDGSGLRSPNSDAEGRGV